MDNKSIAGEIRSIIDALNGVEVKGLSNMHTMTISMVRMSRLADSLEKEESDEA